MSSFNTIDMLLIRLIVCNPLFISVLCVALLFSPNNVLAQPTSDRLPSHLVLKERNRKEKFIIDTTFYLNGKIKAFGKEKIVWKYQGCLGLWPTKFKNGKWKFYSNEGELQTICWFRKGKVRRRKEIPESG